MKIKRTPGEILFDSFNVVLIFLLMIAWIYPLWYTTIASFSDVDAVATGRVVALPKGFNLSAYKLVFETGAIWTSYANTVFYAVVGTALSMFLMSTGGYVLSKRHIFGHKFLTWFALLSMWFGAGMIPSYINYRNLHLLNTRTAVLLTGAVSAFYTILLRTYFESVPAELEESAKLDGAGDIYIFKNIYIPLSIPALMTVTLYCFVGRWNSYFWTMLLVTDESKVSLQVYLRKLVVSMTPNYSESGAIDSQTTSRETMTYATMVVAVLPMLALYPFVQKYFVKGIMVGAIKG